MFEFAASMFIVGVGIAFALLGAGFREGKPAEERKYGPIASAVACPHCGVSGHVRTKTIHQKQGVSNAKAVAAVLTAGLSLLALGIFRMIAVTQAHCMSCASTWII